jgi:hypothetical protein
LHWRGVRRDSTVGAIADRLLTLRARLVPPLPTTRQVRQRIRAHDTEAVSVWSMRSTAAAAHPHWHYDNAPVCGRS